MRIFLSTIALTACASLASAADLGGSVKDGPYGATQYNWSGLYIGAHAGYGTGEWDGTLVYDTGAGPEPGIWDNPNKSIDAEGWLGGFQIGWNRQHGSIVWGIEADATWTDISGEGSFNTASDYYNWRVEQKLDWFGTVRGRLGFLPTQNLLIYATGGIAYGETSANHTSFDLSNFGFVSGRGSANEKHIGWTAGAGAELMFADRWTVRAEWLHVDLGEADYHLAGWNYYGDEPSTTDSFPADLKFDVFRLGVNYKFGG